MVYVPYNICISPKGMSFNFGNNSYITHYTAGRSSYFTRYNLYL